MKNSGTPDTREEEKLWHFLTSSYPPLRNVHQLCRKIKWTTNGKLKKIPGRHHAPWEKTLRQWGEPLSENHFYAIILGFLKLLPVIHIYISAANATLSGLGKTIIQRPYIGDNWRIYPRNKSGKKDENAALYSNDSKKGQKGGSSLKFEKECRLGSIARKVTITVSWIVGL